MSTMPDHMPSKPDSARSTRLRIPAEVRLLLTAVCWAMALVVFVTDLLYGYAAHSKTTVRTVTVSASCPALLHHDQQLQRDLQVMSRGFTLARQDWHRGFRYVMPRFAAVPRTPPTCGETR